MLTLQTFIQLAALTRAKAEEIADQQYDQTRSLIAELHAHVLQCNAVIQTLEQSAFLEDSSMLFERPGEVHAGAEHLAYEDHEAHLVADDPVAANANGSFFDFCIINILP